MTVFTPGRRLRRALFGTLLLTLLGFWLPVPASTAAPQPAPEAPKAEHYRYDISFLWIDRIAEAELQLQPATEKDRWQVRLKAQTLGVAAWLTSERAQHYASTMGLGGNGAFTALRHDSNIIKTKDGRQRVRLKSYLFDHEQQQVVQRVVRDGKAKADVVLPMPPAEPDDILTAFYNFRRGVYGPLVKGGRYRIPTYTRKGPSEIVVDVLHDEQRPSQPRFAAGGVLLRVRLDKEVFVTANGIVYVWLDGQGRPAEVVVEDVIGLGDVRCTLREKGQEA